MRTKEEVLSELNVLRAELAQLEDAEHEQFKQEWFSKLAGKAIVYRDNSYRVGSAKFATYWGRVEMRQKKLYCIKFQIDSDGVASMQEEVFWSGLLQNNGYSLCDEAEARQVYAKVLARLKWAVAA